MINGLQQPVLIQPSPARLSFFLNIKRLVQLKTAIAVNPSAWEKDGKGVLFEIYGTQNKTGEESLLFSSFINPQDRTDQSWIPVEVDLSKYIGKEIFLTFVTSPKAKGARFPDWAGWAEPKLVNYFPATLELVYDGPNKIYENKAVLARAWVVHRVTEVNAQDIQAVKKLISAPNFDPVHEAVLESGSAKSGPTTMEIGRAGPEDNVRVTSYSPREVTVETNLRERGLLILADTMYPGWKAYSDGQELPIYYANLIMRSVFIEKGQHQVLFLYRPTLLVKGFIITSTALFSILLGLIYTARQLKRKKTILER
jgi:hypothetical protein